MRGNLYCQFPLTEDNSDPLISLAADITLSYHDIHHQVARYCNRFHQLGLKPGDRLIQQTEKCIDALLVYLASLRFGTIYVPLNPAFKYDELRYFIDDAQPALFICSPDKETIIAQLVDAAPFSSQIETLSADGSGTLQQQIATMPTHFTTHTCHEDDIAAILYTSGTTGQPKGAMLSHGNLSANGQALKTCWGFSAQDHLLHVLPLFHCHGLFFACHCVLLSGASMTILNKFDVQQVIAYLPDHNVMMGVPTYYTRLLADKRFNRALTHHMRLFTSGSAPLSEKVFSQFQQRTGQKILERYGMTETGINTSNPLRGNRMAGRVGLPLDNVNLRLVDNKNRPINVDQIGYIQISGPAVFKGYWGNPQKTAMAFTDDGYFHSGDIATINKHGSIQLLGRNSDMIISGGLNVYPKEIESIIDSLKGVEESAVVGLPHPDLGEAVTALIVAQPRKKPHVEKIINQIKHRLANYKVPKKIVFIDNLPRNSMSKVQKHRLREIYRQLYFAS